ncbi:MAG: hypothetical protein IJ137_08565 [Eubacterium sp.]|nr:hypothetical protein [Eubacterium sp.]
MNDSSVAISPPFQDDGTDNGGSTPPIVAMPSVLPSGAPAKGKTYTRHYCFTESEAKEMINALEAEIDFLMNIEPFDQDALIGVEVLSLPLGVDPESYPDDWLPF